MKNDLTINVKGNIPEYKTAGAAGADLICNERTVFLEDGVQLVPTGTFIEIPEGYVGLLLPRSSTCINLELLMANSAGVIDSDYRGELMFPYKSDSGDVITIEEGERIGQIVIVPVAQAEFVSVEELSDTERGEGGFGSTNEEQT